MTPPEVPVVVHVMTGKEMRRQRILDENSLRLLEMAKRAVARGLSLKTFIAVCINVDDEAWKGLVDGIMPGHDWDAYRARGETPFARGTMVRKGFVEVLAQQVPDIGPQLLADPPAGCFHALVLSEGGASLSWIELFPQGESQPGDAAAESNVRPIRP